MTNEQTKRLKANFLSWSGGFKPDSVYQIEVYVDAALHTDLNKEVARRFLLDWLEDDSE